MKDYDIFFEACGEGDLKVIAECISATYEVNFVAENGNTPLNMCVECDQIEAAKLLLEEGADSNQLISRRSVLDNHVICSEAIVLCFANSQEMVNELVAHGSDILHVDSNGRTVHSWWLATGVEKSMIEVFFPTANQS